MTIDAAKYLWNGTALGQARALAPHYYTSEEIFKQEIEHIHLKNWFFVARTDELANSGDYRAVDTVGGPVLLTRDEQGELHAFANFCRHRGSILLEGCGNRRNILCPYHAWSYKLDGSMLRAPGMQDVPGFDPEHNALVPIRMSVWRGNIFLNFDDNAPDLMTHLGNFDELVGSNKLEDMVCVWRKDIIAQCNWKLLLENAMETYHTGIVHAKTVGAQDSLTFAAQGQWHAIQVQSSMTSAVLDKTKEAPFPQIEGLSEQAKQGTFFTLVEPTTQFCCAQDCMWWLVVRPISVNQTHLSVGGCFPKHLLELPDFAERAQPYYHRWGTVALEDVGILEKQQKGLSSVRYTPGPLSWRDDVVHDMNNWLLRHLPIAKG